MTSATSDGGISACLIRFHIGMAAVAMVSVVALIALPHTNITFPVARIVGTSIALASFIVLAEYSRRNQVQWMVVLSMVVFWDLFYSSIVSDALFVFGRSPYPLVDSSFAAIDASLHLTSVQVMHAATSLHLIAPLGHIYDCLETWAYVVFFLNLCGRRYAELHRFILANAISLTIGMGFLFFRPGVGPWTIYGFPASPSQAHVQMLIAAMKNGAPLTIAEAPVISFPSYHAVLAVLCAASLWHWRWLRVPAVVLCAAVCLSAVTTGWHYVVDIIGGIALAQVSYYVAGLVIVPARKKEQVRELAAAAS